MRHCFVGRLFPHLKSTAPTPQSARTNARSIYSTYHSEAGFSLLELLIVIGIMALLATLAGPRLVSYFGKAKSQTAEIQIGNLTNALELYHLDVGSYPPQEIGLSGLLTQPADVDRWSGPYLKKKDGVLDPWGRPYIYRFPGEHGAFDLMSLGKDGVEGGTGEDKDLTSW